MFDKPHAISDTAAETFPKHPRGERDVLDPFGTHPDIRDVRGEWRAFVKKAQPFAEPVVESPGLRCPICNVLRGTWIKTHCAPGQERPCAGSWK